MLTDSGTTAIVLCTRVYYCGVLESPKQTRPRKKEGKERKGIKKK
jgi:hypothetical protein